MNSCSTGEALWNVCFECLHEGHCPICNTQNNSIFEGDTENNTREYKAGRKEGSVNDGYWQSSLFATIFNNYLVSLKMKNVPLLFWQVTCTHAANQEQRGLCVNDVVSQQKPHSIPFRWNSNACIISIDLSLHVPLTFFSLSLCPPLSRSNLQHSQHER